MKIRTLLTKIFLVIYLVLLFPHILEIPFSLLTIVIFTLGLFLAVKIHRTNSSPKARKFGAIFLVLHMVLELPHMIEHIGHDEIGMILGHGLHVIFDLVFLYTLTKSIQYFIFLIFIILITGAIMNSLSIEIMSETRPFVLGGVLGCVGTHLLFKKLHKKLAL